MLSPHNIPQTSGGQGCEAGLARDYSECSQSSSVLLFCQDGSDGDGEYPATCSSARRFISRFARA